MPAITKEQFDRLYDPEISKREYDEILKLIDARFEEIVPAIANINKHKGWYAYGNVEDDPGEGAAGFFDVMDLLMALW